MWGSSAVGGGQGLLTCRADQLTRHLQTHTRSVTRMHQCLSPEHECRDWRRESLTPKREWLLWECACTCRVYACKLTYMYAVVRADNISLRMYAVPLVQYFITMCLSVWLLFLVDSKFTSLLIFMTFLCSYPDSFFVQWRIWWVEDTKCVSANKSH